MNNLAIIPARSGSKGIVDKNVRELAGKALIAYTIEAAKESGIFSQIMVSTDSMDYAKIAKTYGAEIPFYRSKELATGSASSWEVVEEVLSFYKERGVEFDMFTLLQPTSPLRNAEDISGAFDLYIEKKATAVVSVCEMEHSPLWSNILPSDLSMDGFVSKEHNIQRQQLIPYYRINGAIYMISCKSFQRNADIYSSSSYAYVMSAFTSVDIDTELDFKVAETILGSFDYRNS